MFPPFLPMSILPNNCNITLGQEQFYSTFIKLYCILCIFFASLTATLYWYRSTQHPDKPAIFIFIFIPKLIAFRLSFYLEIVSKVVKRLQSSTFSKLSASNSTIPSKVSAKDLLFLHSNSTTNDKRQTLFRGWNIYSLVESIITFK